MYLYMNVTVCKCRSEGAFLSAYGHNMCTAVCECECVRFNKHLNCFPIWLSSASDRTPNLIPQGHPLHTLFIFLLSLGYGNLFQPLSRPTTTIFLLPPTRLNFRNILNLLPIDFPPEFTLLLKIQSIKKGDTFNAKVDTYRYYHTVVKQACRIHSYCAYTCTRQDTHTG